MKTWNWVCETEADLNQNTLLQNLQENGINPDAPLFIQVFTGVPNKQFIESLLDKLNAFFPQAKIIGSTTDGEIAGMNIYHQHTVLSFTQFEKTSVRTVAVPYDLKIDSRAAGLKLAEALLTDQTKALILYADGLQTNGEEIVKAIESVNPHVVVAGGLAADNVTFQGTFVFTNDRILSRGIVGAALDSDELIVNTSYHFDWTRIGKQMTVTRSELNRVYEIDHLPAIEIYKKYLGEEVASKLPRISGLFPLVVNKDNYFVAKAVLGTYPDGSLSFAGNIHQGDQVQFAYGNAEMVLRSAIRTSEKLAELPIESVFVYICSGRRRFMAEFMGKEMELFATSLPIAGFFAYGEFFHFAGRNEQLSQTLTLLLLSETREIQPREKQINYQRFEENDSLEYLQALAHLINETSEELQCVNQALRDNEERYRRLVEMSPDTIAVLSQGKIIYVNQAGVKLIGVDSPEQVYGMSYEELVHPDDLETAMDMTRRTEQGQVQGELKELKLVRPDGKVIMVEMMTLPFTYQNQSATQVFIRDVTEQRKNEERIKRQAYFDSLTHLPNRRLFHKRLTNALKLVERSGHMLAVLFLDLDRFKYINDTLGHGIGDSLLRQVARRLTNCLRESDTVARLGGDEFTILLPNLKDEQDAIDVAQRIVGAMLEPFRLNGYEFFLTTSIGISFYPKDGDQFDTLIKHADMAMYYAKEQGRNNYQVYQPDLNAKAVERLIIENYLRKALQNEELNLHYQPIVEIATGQVTGVEALLRWEHPELGRVSPNEYISIAEETGLIIPIGEWVLKTACVQNKAWQDAGLPFVRVGVNLSTRQFLQGDMVETISRVLQETGLEPQWLDIELTETIMQNSDETISALHVLKKMGVHISLDDFGTGYSSLSYLKRMPIDTLKIDQTFVSDMRIDAGNMAIAQAIISMAHALDMRIVAEGVETKEQLKCLKNMQCDCMQGYLFSKPVPAEEFQLFLTHYL